jgi:GNAT superfamily N-acetyltransferase
MQEDSSPPRSDGSIAGVIVGEPDSRDVPAMLELLAELFRQERDFRPDPDKQLRALRLILANPEKGHLFVARTRGRVVGMATVLSTVSTAEGGPVLLLEDVVVSASYRGEGIGRVLVDHLLQWAAEQGFLRVSLVTDADNHGAHRFYENLGFVPSEMRLFRRNLGSSPM